MCRCVEIRQESRFDVHYFSPHTRKYGRDTTNLAHSGPFKSPLTHLKAFQRASCQSTLSHQRSEVSREGFCTPDAWTPSDTIGHCLRQRECVCEHGSLLKEVYLACVSASQEKGDLRGCKLPALNAVFNYYFLEFYKKKQHLYLMCRIYLMRSKVLSTKSCALFDPCQQWAGALAAERLDKSVFTTVSHS